VITSVVNAVPPGEGRLTIIEDDPPPTITVTGTIVSESAGVAMVTLQLSEPLTFSTALLYFTEDGSAASPSDYSGTPMTSTPQIAAGTTTATITIPIQNDAVAEGTESFSVRVSAFSSAIIPATVTILDDDTTGRARRRSVRR
jgi:hypothetical protein